MSHFITVIPARAASTRLPGKPLVDLGGKSMIQRVVEQARQSSLSRVVVATDDERIRQMIISRLHLIEYNDKGGPDENDPMVSLSETAIRLRTWASVIFNSSCRTLP